MDYMSDELKIASSKMMNTYYIVRYPSSKFIIEKPLNQL